MTDLTIFYLGLGAAVVVLSILVIWSDTRARRRRLKRVVKTTQQEEWDKWSDMVTQIIEASSPPDQRQARLDQFYRDNPKPEDGK